MNPTAKVYCNGVSYGTATGCGYDKESTAIAEAISKNNSILKLIYTIKNEALQKDFNNTSEQALGYGFGYYSLPYFEGGVGTDCFLRMFKNAGFEVFQEHSKISDCYIIKKEGIV